MNELSYGLRISNSDLVELIGADFETELAMYRHFALLAWSGVCEPGDLLSGSLISALGPVGALQAELDETPISRMMSTLRRSEASTSGHIDFDDAFEKSYADARQRWKPRISLPALKSAIATAKNLGARTITSDFPEWPKGLNDLEAGAPKALWVRGELNIADTCRRGISVVGSRGSTAYGEFATTSLVSALVASNLAVISGGAYGIDGIAHRSALAMHGETIAVMAGGIDNLYPSGNINLFEHIIEHGALLSELPPGFTPTKWRFLMRNRLIAALGKATLVVEANWRSGALSTANHCRSLKRPIFAVPGPINSPQSSGVNKLIAEGEGVQLVLDSAHFLEKLGGPAVPLKALESMGALETRVFDAIGFGAVDVSEICSEAGLTRSEAHIALGSLELDGLVTRTANKWSRAQTTV